jgi:hypothetical protein
MISNWADATAPDEKHDEVRPDDLPRWDGDCPSPPSDHASTIAPGPPVPTDGSEATS